MAEKTSIRLDQDIIIPSCGFRTAGTVVTKEEAGDSYEWLLRNEIGHLVGQKTTAPIAAVVANEEVDVPEVDTIVQAIVESEITEGDQEAEVTSETTVEPEGEIETETDDKEEVVNEQKPVASEDAKVIVAVKELLAQGKMHLKTIVQQSGLTEEVVAPLLTEANGFRKNQQGWFSNI
jgi:beta-phosphoglucomutase-like phosphatase (HAD superfamily)